MPVSLSDFMSQVNSHVGPTGAVFSTAPNPDGTVKIFRAPSAAAAGVPQSQLPVLFPRVAYNSPNDTVIIGDGSGQSVSPASAFIAGLS
jgi:hypothetical protein